MILCFEKDGHHFHSYPRLQKHYHWEKSRASRESGIRLIHFTDIDWLHNKEVVKKTLRHALGIIKDKKYASRLTVSGNTELTSTRRSFYRKNHLHGDPSKGITYSLIDRNKQIFALMTFTSIRSDTGTWELVRYATKSFIVGGESKLFTAFLKEYTPKKIIAYSYNDWCDGEIYTLLGFRKVRELGPDYRTVWHKQLKHRSYTRRNSLKRLLGNRYDPEVSVMENLTSNSKYIIYTLVK